MLISSIPSALSIYMRVLFGILSISIFPSHVMTSVDHVGKKRIFIVSSYDPNYLWSQSTNRGVITAMLRYGYLDDEEQVNVFTENDFVESSSAIIKKSWMHTKRRNSSKEIAEATLRIMLEIEAFKPDLVMLGDDNAANYIGNQLLDTQTPVVFWGINGLPLNMAWLTAWTALAIT